jgi:hypothetical protein
VANVGGSLVAAGITSRGVVVVNLPTLTNPFPSSPVLPPRTVTNGKPVIIRATGKKLPTQQ